MLPGGNLSAPNHESRQQPEPDAHIHARFLVNSPKCVNTVNFLSHADKILIFSGETWYRQSTACLWLGQPPPASELHACTFCSASIALWAHIDLQDGPSSPTPQSCSFCPSQQRNTQCFRKLDSAGAALLTQGFYWIEPPSPCTLFIFQLTQLKLIGLER